MIIDVHTHYRSKQIFDELLKRGQMRTTVDKDGKTHVYDGDMYVFTMPEQYAEPDLEKRIEYLDQHGIERRASPAAKRRDRVTGEHQPGRYPA